MKFLEKVLALMALLGVVMKLVSIPGGEPVIAIALLLLGVLYLLGSVFLFNDITLRGLFKKSSYAGINAWRIVVSIFTSFILFLSIASVLAFILYGDSRITMLYYATGVDFTFTVFIAVLQSIKHVSFYRNILSRTFVVFIVMACLTFTPTKYLAREKSKVISMDSRFYGK